MVTLYLASSTGRSGKTTVAAAVGTLLQAQHKKVGYLRLTSAAERSGGDHSDAALMKALLGLEATAEELSPDIADGSLHEGSVKGPYDSVAAGKDVVIVEAPAGFDRATADIATGLDAKVVVVESYSTLPVSVPGSYDNLGNRLIGVVLNKVPRSRLAEARDSFAGSGVKVLGIIPEDRSLLSPTVAELAQAIGGRIVCGENSLSGIVEGILLGAMSPDQGPEYYRRKANKAAIVRSERPDMQLAALETSTRCLVIAGKAAPVNIVQRRAEAKGVPIVAADGDMAVVVAKVETAFRRSRLNAEKAARAGSLAAENLNLGMLYGGLGLA